MIKRHSIAQDLTPLQHSSENLKPRNVLRLRQEAEETKMSA